MSNFVTPEQFAAANKTNVETLLTMPTPRSPAQSASPP